MRFYDRVAELTLHLAEHPSVNGSQGEADILEDAYGMLSRLPVQERLRVFRGEDAAGRPAFVLAHLKGTGSRCVVQFGHIDTVGVDDYGPLRPLAFKPLALTRRIAEGALGPELSRLAAGGDWLFGRGVLDMKAGVAATIAVLEQFAAQNAAGHLLVALTSDEEAGSRGIRALTRFLAPYLREERLELAGIINTDATGPRLGRDGPFERFVYSGSVGKLLPCAYVRGVPSHVGEPEAGLDPNFVLAEITRRVVYSQGLSDGVGDERSAVPVSLQARDDKAAYDVQTPLSAVGCYNVLYVSRRPADVLRQFRAIAEDAAQSVRESLVQAFGGAPEIPVYTFEELTRLAEQRGLWSDLRPSLATGLTGASGPAQRIAATGRLADAVLGREPAIVLFFGNGLIPKVATQSHGRRVLNDILTQHAAVTGNSYRQGRFFPLISDLSFVAASEDWQDAAFAANDPVAAVTAAEAGPSLVADAVYMIGPHGEGAHRVDERLFMPYSFEHVPDLLIRLTEELWRHPMSTRS